MFLPRLTFLNEHNCSLIYLPFLISTHLFRFFFHSLCIIYVYDISLVHTYLHLPSSHSRLVSSINFVALSYTLTSYLIIIVLFLMICFCLSNYSRCIDRFGERPGGKVVTSFIVTTNIYGGVLAFKHLCGMDDF